MKRTRNILGIAALACGVLASFGSLARAQQDNNGNCSDFQACGTRVRPIGITKIEDLEFGYVVPPPSGTGTVTLEGTGDENNFTPSPEEFDPSSIYPGPALTAAKPPHMAEFAITGEPGYSFHASTAGSFLLKEGTPSWDLHVHDVDVEGNDDFDSNGDATIYIGGVLYVPSDANPGLYTHTFQVEVNYN